ncbi:hypothetical protein EUTSA_v10028871mg [Eutrema salsugineum]|uniref:Chlorophyll a-b binding protein, chloroplastic n=1 Tax=Eutrema salsugineum TaxID=72664 RepID=V4L881_EUTSA|nr:hypothetical protein EUTSA_v10028871mg [Eutrema salsugineum]
MASLGVSEMLGTPLNFRAVSRSSAPLASSPATFKTVALFSKKKPAPPPKKTVSVANDELAKWYGPDRRIFLPDGLLDRSEIPEYLNGEVAGDYGYDPFGLGKKPENFAKYQAFELIHARWAMLGAAGFIIPEALNKYGANCGPEAVWFKTGALLLDGNTLNYFGKNIPINLVLAVVAEVVLLGGAEYYRITNGLVNLLYILSYYSFEFLTGNTTKLGNAKNLGRISKTSFTQEVHLILWDLLRTLNKELFSRLKRSRTGD